MNTINNEKLEQLLSIINIQPETQIVHFCDKELPLHDTIAKFCLKHNFLYRLNSLDDILTLKLQEKHKNHELISANNFQLKRARYMTQGKIYNYLFVDATISELERSDFIQKCHPIIKNAGNIIVMLPKNSYELRDSWTSLLEEHYYVATNTIDDLLDDWDVLVSKKMHGWGG